MSHRVESIPPENLYNFSEETLEWLGSWLSNGGDASEITEDVKNELLMFQNIHREEYDEKLTLYRGCKNEDVIVDGVITFGNPSSWSRSEEMAMNFADNGLVISTEVDSDIILIDTTLLEPQWIASWLGGFPEEEEVILLPGSY